MERSCAVDEALTSKGFEILVDGPWRIFQPGPDRPGASGNRAGRQIDQTRDEGVRMQSGQIPRGQPVRGEVLEVESHDYVRATLDRRREDMPIVCESFELVYRP